jgi:hypothetical protein
VFSYGVYVEIFRCQVRVPASNGMSPCAAEATYWDSYEVKTPAGAFAVLLCADHAGPSAESIGSKSNDELRSHVRFFGAEPQF